MASSGYYSLYILLTVLLLSHLGCEGFNSDHSVSTVTYFTLNRKIEKCCNFLLNSFNRTDLDLVTIKCCYEERLS